MTVINHAVGNGPTGIISDKSIRTIKQSTETSAMRIIYIEVE